MSQRYTLHADDANRPLVLSNIHAFLDRLPDSKSWRIEIREYKPDRSDKQNRALWGVAYPAIMEATGLQGEREKEQLHRQMCGEFFGWKDHALLGRVPVRTTTVNEHGERDLVDSAVMAEFYGFVQRIGAEFGIDVPSPEPEEFRCG